MTRRIGEGVTRKRWDRVMGRVGDAVKKQLFEHVLRFSASPRLRVTVSPFHRVSESRHRRVSASLHLPISVSPFHFLSASPCHWFIG